MNKYEKAILDLIAYTEGTLGVSQNGYDVLVGYYKINGWENNTDIVHGKDNWAKVFSNGLKSTAAGRYQFIYKTWVSINGKTNKPMTKDNQDVGAMYLVNKRLKQTDLETRSVSIENLANKDDFDIFLNKIAREWASIPLSKTFVVDGKYKYAGSSYYSSDGVNNSKDSPSELHEIYKEALSLYS